MLDTIFLLAIEGLSGKKLATHIGELGSSIVTERTVRNWVGGKSQPSAQTIEAIVISEQHHLREKLRKLNSPLVGGGCFQVFGRNMLLAGIAESLCSLDVRVKWRCLSADSKACNSN